MLLGLIRPTRGRGALFGRDPLSTARGRSTGVAGFVEAPRFYPYLTGRKNLELLRRLRRRRRARAGSTRCSRRSSSPTAAKRQRRRLLARHAPAARDRRGAAAPAAAAAARRAGDRASTRPGMRDMRDARAPALAEGMTVMLSSHLMTEVEELCNRVAIIRAAASSTRARLASCWRVAGTRLPAARLRRSPSARASAPPASAWATGVVEPATSCASAATRPSVERLTIALGQAERRRPRARPRAGDARAAVLRAHRVRRRRRRRAGARARGGAPDADVLTVYRWELRKLVSQKRTYLGLGAAIAVPLIFVVALAAPERLAERRRRSAATSASRASRSRSSCCSSGRSGCSR